MIPYKFPIWIRKTKQFFRKFGILFSLLFSTYKAWDYRVLWIGQVERNEIQNTIINDLREIRSGEAMEMRKILYQIQSEFHDFNDFPFPFWIKIYDPVNDIFRMVYINSAYSEHYGIQRIDYLGKEDQSVYNDSTGKVYRAGDLAALHSDVPINIKEMGIDGAEDAVIKWRVDEGSETYIYGFSIVK